VTTPIAKRRLGRTDLQVTELGLGGVFVRTAVTAPGEGVRVVQRALELGVNYLDTAPLYGDSQQVLGEALQDVTAPYLLGAKCGRWDWETGPYRSLDAFKRQFEQTLRDLRRDEVDILYIHEADWAPYWTDMSVPRTTQFLEPDAEYDFDGAPVAVFLRWVKDQRRARFLGISGNNAHLLAKVLREMETPIDVVLTAFQYSLLWRNAPHELFPLAAELDVGVVLGAPLQQGRLAQAYPEWVRNPPDWMDEDLRARYERLYAIQAETGLSLAELAIRFLLRDRRFASVIPGAASIEQIEENVRCATAGPLPDELHARLDALGRVFVQEPRLKG
jgi:aryl-alcohol dehydrogenase-like predicted oxidoreductase